MQRLLSSLKLLGPVCIYSILFPKEMIYGRPSSKKMWHSIEKSTGRSWSRTYTDPPPKEPIFTQPRFLNQSGTGPGKSGHRQLWCPAKLRQDQGFVLSSEPTPQFGSHPARYHMRLFCSSCILDVVLCILLLLLLLLIFFEKVESTLVSITMSAHFLPTIQIPETVWRPPVDPIHRRHSEMAHENVLARQWGKVLNMGKIVGRMRCDPRPLV